jgi:hypothetical protein
MDSSSRKECGSEFLRSRYEGRGLRYTSLTTFDTKHCCRKVFYAVARVTKSKAFRRVPIQFTMRLRHLRLNSRSCLCPTCWWGLLAPSHPGFSTRRYPRYATQTPQQNPKPAPGKLHPNSGRVPFAHLHQYRSRISAAAL